MASSESETLIYNASKIEDLAVELSGLLNQFNDEVEEIFSGSAYNRRRSSERRFSNRSSA